MTQSHHDDDNEPTFSESKLKAIKTLTITMGFVLVFALGIFVFMLANKDSHKKDTVTVKDNGVTEHALSLPAGARLQEVTTEDRKIITHYKTDDGKYGVDIYDTYTGKTQRAIIK